MPDEQMVLRRHSEDLLAELKRRFARLKRLAIIGIGIAILWLLRPR